MGSAEAGVAAELEATAGREKGAAAVAGAVGAGGAALALCLRQPWAALVIGGVKTVEVRAWAPRWRGRLLIHTARQIDRRREVWQQLPDRLWALSQRRGGVVGVCMLADCVAYATEEAFAADRERHRMDANPWGGWPVYGWVLHGPVEVPFQPVRGRRGLFAVVLEGAPLLTQGFLPFA